VRSLVRRVTAVIAVAGAGAMMIAAWRGHPTSPPPSPSPSPLGRPGAAGRPDAPPAVSQARATPSVPPQLPGPPAAAPSPSRIDLEGDDRAIDSAALAARSSALTARDRRAWRLSELLPDSYLHSGATIHALTSDGRDYILRGDGRGGDDVIVVRRNTGELYLGWLDGGPRDGRALADAERPAERLEHVVRIARSLPAPATEAARLTVVIDGAPRRVVTPDGFPAAARLAIQDPRRGASPAIDLARAFGGPLQLVGLVSGGAHLAATPPAGDARAVVYLTRRGRFKLAWIDAAGQPIGSALREVSEVTLRSAPRT
jgi:hypothetical protein